jgi:hypothetical protein
LPAPNGPSPSDWSLPLLCELIWDAETRFGLLDWTVDGVKPWIAARFSVYKQLASTTGLIEGGAADRPWSWPDRVRRHTRLLWGAILSNPFRLPGRYDVLVFESSRTAVIDNVRTCPYTHEIAERLVRDGKRVLRLDPELGGVHDKSADPQRRFLDATALESGLRFRVSRWRPGLTDLAFLREIEEHFTVALSRRIALGWLLDPGIPRFRAAYVTYRRLLTRYQPEEIYCVAAYGGLASLVAAAKDLGIRAIEVQHAVVSRYHLGYSYPGQPKAKARVYLPDRFLAWNREWNEASALACQIELATPHWQPLADRYRAAAKQRGLMVVLSQPTITRRLLNVLIDRRDELGAFQVMLKLHPAELQDEHVSDALRAFLAVANYTLAPPGSIYDLLPGAEFQVGVYSTALCQGLELGCRLLIVPLPGFEHLERLLSTGGATLLDEFLSSLSEAS